MVMRTRFGLLPTWPSLAAIDVIQQQLFQMCSPRTSATYVAAHVRMYFFDVRTV
jgi:hypothetical protein